MSFALARPTLRWPGVTAAAARLEALLALEQARLAPWLAVALGVGMLAFFALPADPPAAVVWVAPPLVLLAVWLGQRRPFAGWLLGLAAAAALGFAAAAWHTGRQPPPLDLPRTATIVSGRVASVDLLPEGRRLTIEAPSLDGGEALPRHLRIRLRATDPAMPRPGDTVRVRALVRAPAYPGAWDFQRFAYFSGLGGSGFALAAAAVTPGEVPPPAFAGLRATMEARVTAALPGAAGAVASALLTGGQSAIPPAISPPCAIPAWPICCPSRGCTSPSSWG